MRDYSQYTATIRGFAKLAVVVSEESIRAELHPTIYLRE